MFKHILQTKSSPWGEGGRRSKKKGAHETDFEERKGDKSKGAKKMLQVSRNFVWDPVGKEHRPFRGLLSADGASPRSQAAAKACFGHLAMPR